MEKVWVLNFEDYSKVRDVLKEFLLENFSEEFKPGMKVLVKPNLISPRPPEEAVTTHPSILRATLEFLLDLGTKPFVGDSPAFSSFQTVAKVTGVEEVCRRLGVEFGPLDDPVVVKGELFRGIKVSKRVLESDAVVNLPKLKTHSQMVLTLGVKNTFGCVVGLEKSAWHMRAKDYDDFANFLIDVHRLVSPKLTILDGIEGMDGNGPTNGRKRFFGVLVVSRNAFALDEVVCKMVGLNPDYVYTVKHARRRNLVPTYEVIADRFPTFDIELPNTVSPLAKLSRIFAPVFVRVPKIDKGKCVKCGLCEARCPASAIDLHLQRIDYNKCIRCYVCHEVCPHGAILLVRKLFR